MRLIDGLFVRDTRCAVRRARPDLHTQAADLLRWRRFSVLTPYAEYLRGQDSAIVLIFHLSQQTLEGCLSNANLSLWIDRIPIGILLIGKVLDKSSVFILAPLQEFAHDE